MGRLGITYRDVAAAAAEIQGHNQHPTVDRIREILGTGSKSTIARLLKQWKINQGPQAFSENLPEPLLAMVKGLWDHLQADATTRIDEQQEIANKALAELEQQLLTAQRAYRDLQAIHHTQEEQLHYSTEQVSQLQQALVTEKQHTIKLSEREQALTQHLADQKTEGERLHQLLTHVQANLEHYQTAVQKLREEQALEAEKVRLVHEQEQMQLKQELTALQTAHLNLQRELDPLRAALKLAEKQREQVALDLQIAQQSLQAKIADEANLLARHTVLSQTAAEQAQTLAGQTKHSLILEKDVAVLTEQLATLKLSQQDAQDKIQLLRDEKLFLAQEKAHLEGQLKQLQEMLAHKRAKTTS